MKRIHLVIVVAIVFILNACNLNKESANTQKKEVHPISKAYGYENWNAIEKVSFVFNVEKGTDLKERSWVWFPKTDSVISMTWTDTVYYNRKNKLNPMEVEVDQLFINDRFWVFCPLNLTWDQGISFSEVKKAKAPISGKEMNKQTALYANEGGYTPGDAYDFYFDDKHLIKEWVFRRGNSEEPTIVDAWSENITEKGITVATEHFSADSSFHLFISNLKIE